MSSSELTWWSESFALLGDPARLDLLLCLRDEGPRSVSALAESVGRSPSAVSHSLRLLRAHRIVRSERVGRTVVYALADHQVGELLSGLPGRVRPASPGEVDGAARAAS
jgi:ArsR family transcriptional regulator, lead/cadmium/zinc/bismuth-responsive transcriptional repressor